MGWEAESWSVSPSTSVQAATGTSATSWAAIYFLGSHRSDESAKTTSETVAETCRIRREFEINVGIQPIQQAQVGKLASLYIDSLPPQTSHKHRHEVARVLKGLLRLCGFAPSIGTTCGPMTSCMTARTTAGRCGC